MQRKLVRSAVQRALSASVVQLAAAVVVMGAAKAEQAHPPIVLALDPCTQLDAQEVRRLVPIELGAPLAGRPGPSRETTRVSAGCVLESPSVLRLEVRDPATGKAMDRFITLRGVPRTDQARLVAIAAVELVAASWSELAREPESIGVAAATTVPAEAGDVTFRATPPEPPLPPSRWRVSAVGTVRHFDGVSRLAPGAGLAVERSIRRRLAVSADLLAEKADPSTSLGVVDALLVSASLSGLARAELARLTLEAGGGARLGVARLAGRQPAAAVRAGVVTAPWGGPLALLRASLSVTRRLSLAVGSELGYATGGALGRVSSASDVSVHGPWWGATLAVGYAY